MIPEGKAEVDALGRRVARNTVIVYVVLGTVFVVLMVSALVVLVPLFILFA
ncbi:MAG TPA: hypothetical protein QGF58_17995 [Myxococcota bacterium]|nr:hypothetical protein [Myxococcota bacterium]